MSTSVHTGLNPFNFIRKHFLRICVGKSLCTFKSCWMWCPRASIHAWTRLILFANTFWILLSEIRYALIKVFGSDFHECRYRSEHLSYRSLSVHRLSECTVFRPKIYLSVLDYSTVYVQKLNLTYSKSNRSLIVSLNVFQCSDVLREFF
jgi:hypothetical protein